MLGVGTLLFVANATNDLLDAVRQSPTSAHVWQTQRFVSIAAALKAARPHDGLVITAQGYSAGAPTIVPSGAEWNQINALGLATYLEFPSQLTVSSSKKYANVTTAGWRRVVVRSNASFAQWRPANASTAANLGALGLLDIHKSARVVEFDEWSSLNRTDILSLARVAGFDTAVDGLPTAPSRVQPLLSQVHRGVGAAPLLVATTALTECRRARFAPSAAWHAIASYIVTFVQQQQQQQQQRKRQQRRRQEEEEEGNDVVRLEWTPLVRPTYDRHTALPPNAEIRALHAGVEWYRRAAVLPNAPRLSSIQSAWRHGKATGTSILMAVPANGSIEAMPSKGQMGVIEGYVSDVATGLMDSSGHGMGGSRHGTTLRAVDGSQPQTTQFRGDCAAETALAFAMRYYSTAASSTVASSSSPPPAPAAMETADRRTAINLLSFAWGGVSGMQQGWNPPNATTHPSDTFGLVAWTTEGAPAKLFYKDDDARGLLAGVGVSGVLHLMRSSTRAGGGGGGGGGGERWFHSELVRATLGNLRITGTNSFGPSSETFDRIVANGWESYYHSAGHVQYSPHYQSWIWALYLWLYPHSQGFSPLLERPKKAMGIMMAGYPSRWVPTQNGITMQRARMLLPLAWLLRVEPTVEHKAWLVEVADGLLTRQAACGAIQEEVSAAGWGGAARVPTNDDYGTFESPLNQGNDDPVSDLLYTSSFAFIGLHEAAAALEAYANHDSAAAQEEAEAEAEARGEEDARASGGGGGSGGGRTTTATPPTRLLVDKYRMAEGRLADFLIRIQTTADEGRPELHGAYFRAFDFHKWDVWASDADAGWGAWSIETGWTMPWIVAAFGLRTRNTSLWDVGSAVDVADEFSEWVGYFFP